MNFPAQRQTVPARRHRRTDRNGHRHVAAVAFLCALCAASFEVAAQEIVINHYTHRGCVTVSGEWLLPDYAAQGDIARIPEGSHWDCERVVNSAIQSCEWAVEAPLSSQNEQHPECLAVFAAEVDHCIAHYENERLKCTGSADAIEPLGPNWIVTENQPCQLYNPEPEPGETVTWSGGCADGKATGEGRIVWRGSYGESVYEGTMHNGKVHGYGTYAYSSGNRYQGEFRDGKAHGIGIGAFSGGGRYEGEWRNGERHGQGTYTWFDGSRYQGEWRNGERHGQGTYIYPDGSRYQGEFRGGQRQGHGTYVWPDGSRYQGEYRNNKPNGYGTYTGNGIVLYQGQWRDGCSGRDGDNLVWLDTTRAACGF